LNETEGQNYKVNFKIPDIFIHRKVGDEVDIKLAAYLEEHFFFVVSHKEVHANQAIFQKYSIDKDMNELKFVQEV